MVQDALPLTLPDGSVKSVASGTTPLEVAAGIGPGLAKAAVGAELDGRTVDLRQPLALGGAVPDLHHQEPGGGRVHPPQRRARPRRRGQALVAGRRDRRRAPGPLGEVPVRLPLPARLHPGGPRADRGHDARDPRRGERLRAPRGLARGGRADLPRDGREPEGRAPRRHPRGRDDHGLQARRLPGPLPRPARALGLPDRGGQAPRSLGRLLPGRRVERDAPADLRHGVRLEEGARGVPRAPGAGARPRPPEARRRARPLQLQPARSGLALLPPAGGGRLQRPGRLHPRKAPRRRLRRGDHAADPRRRALAHLRALGELQGRHVLHPVGGAASSRSSR